MNFVIKKYTHIFFAAIGIILSGYVPVCAITDAQRKKLANMQEKLAAVDFEEIRTKCVEGKEKIKKLPPEAFMSPLERLKQKPVVQVEAVIKTVEVPVTAESTDDHIEVDLCWWRDNAPKRAIPLTATFKCTGRNILQAGLLGTAYGVDYLKYKNLQKIDEDILLKNILTHKDRIITLLQSLKYTGKRSTWGAFKSGMKSFFEGKILERRLFNFFKKMTQKQEIPPDDDTAFAAFEAFMKKECIKPSIIPFSAQLPTSLGYMAAQEGMCLVRDKIIDKPVSTFNRQSGFMKTCEALESINAVVAFWTGRVSMVAECYNNKTNKITIPVELLAAPFFGASYAFYFMNSHETNKKSLSKWILKWAYPKASLDWLNSYWFYLMKKTAMHLRFIQQSQAHYEQIIVDYCGIQSKKLLAILTGTLDKPVDKDGVQEQVKTERVLLQEFIKEAQQESFYAWRDFKFTSLNRTSMFFELATILPAAPQICSVLSKLWEFIRPD